MALGLIGVLEVLWQGFAFQSEANIDRAAAVQRSLRYLRSVFPGRIRPTAPPVPQPHGRALTPPARLPHGAYADAALLAAERERLLRPAWQLLGHEAELRAAGDFLSGDLAGERAMVVRGERGRCRCSATPAGAGRTRCSRCARATCAAPFTVLRTH